jgi:hypothetical protein
MNNVLIRAGVAYLKGLEKKDSTIAYFNFVATRKMCNDKEYVTIKNSNSDRDSALYRVTKTQLKKLRLYPKNWEV